MIEITLIVIKSTYPMEKVDEVINIWLDEMSQAVPFEPFEKMIVPAAATIKEGNIVEALAIGYVDAKMATKAKRLAKKRWKVYEKVEGFSYTMDVYETGIDPVYEERYIKWKKLGEFANLKEIF